MAREAAYWMEFQPKIRKGMKGMARELAEYEIIEVLQPILISVRWKEKARVIQKGKVIREYWQEYSGLVEYKPGEVLHREWRGACEWEIEEWKTLSEEKLKELGVFRKDGEFFIQVVEKIRDLPAAVRQRGRHIPAKKIARVRRGFVLAGDTQILGNYAIRLSSLLQEFLKGVKPSPQLTEKASDELVRLFQLLEGSRTSLKRRALKEIQLTKEGKLKFWVAVAKVSVALSDLLNQRVQDYEIAMKSIKLAGKWLRLQTEIERRFRDCYNRLGQLGEELQRLLSSGEVIQPKDLLRIANEAYGIWKHLTEKVPNFNPYYRRLQEPEFQRLSRVKAHAQQGRAETVLNDIKEATAKLEAVAIGEKPTRAELRKEKETLF